MATLPHFLVLPTQLHRSILTLPREQKVVLVELPKYFRSQRATKAELVTYRASLQALRERLLVKGYEVEYLEAPAFSSLQSVLKHLAAAGATSLQTYPLPSFKEEHELVKACKLLGISLKVVASQGFLFQSEWLPELRGEERVASRFTSFLRQKLKLLVDGNGNPVGGSWKLPQVPKRKYTLEVTLPERNRYVEEAAAYVAKHFPRVKGGVAGVPSPVTFADAEDQLEYVLEGDWQASPEQICERYIMPSVVLGLLLPGTVVQRLCQQKNTPPAAVEAFLRPVLKREWQRFQVS